MRIIKVTELEAQVLKAIVDTMYAEIGFSDAGLEDVAQKTKLPTQQIRGVAASLIKKDLLEIDNREGYFGIDSSDPRQHIWYLKGAAEGLVKAWVEESQGLIEPSKLKVVQ